MLVQDIRAIAREHGLKTSGLNKVALVRAIQASEGNFDCFARATDGICDQPDCRWREDCLGKLKAV